MPIEDIADKARRNLMGVAAGIIAVWALGIPLDGKLVGAVNLNEVQPWRAWLCALVVLAYFYCRFRLAPDNTAARTKYQEEKEYERIRRIRAYANAQFNLYLKGASATLHFNLTPPPMANLVPREASPEGQIIWGPKDKDGLPGTLSFYYLTPDGTPVSGTWQGQAEFRIPIGWLRIQSSQDHWNRVRHMNWAGLEVTLPTTLTVLAAGICLVKLAASVYYSWPFAPQLVSI